MEIIRQHIERDINRKLILSVQLNQFISSFSSLSSLEIKIEQYNPRRVVVVAFTPSSQLMRILFWHVRIRMKRKVSICSSCLSRVSIIVILGANSGPLIGSYWKLNYHSMLHLYVCIPLYDPAIPSWTWCYYKWPTVLIKSLAEIPFVKSGTGISFSILHTTHRYPTCQQLQCLYLVLSRLRIELEMEMETSEFGKQTPTNPFTSNISHVTHHLLQLSFIYILDSELNTCLHPPVLYNY